MVMGISVRWRRAEREDGTMSPGARDELLERLGTVPAAAPLLDRLESVPGVYLVGGAVRDLLLGVRPADLDLVFDREPAELTERLGGAVRAHDRFGTATVELDGHTYDIGRARRESYARPGALPDVEPAGLGDDLARRDFTVNAIALAISGPSRGDLTAAPRALEDLAARRLRVLHDASFSDDPTRLLRLARYAARLGFSIEPRTFELAIDAVAAGALRTVSGTRTGADLRLLAGEETAITGFERMRELGADTAIHSDFGIDDSELADRAIELLPDDGRRDELLIALAARRIAPAELAELLDALAFTSGARASILAAATRSDALARSLAGARRPSEIADAVGEAGPELVAIAGALGPEEPARRWLDSLRDVKLEIDGSSLLEAGIPSGPAVGAGLRAALAAKLDGRTSGTEDELAAALLVARASG
jgi:tRNA nucleotidyltransferase (CCA-adding enzyme)